MRRARAERALATAVASSVLGNSPTISHLFSAVWTQSSYCFHLAISYQFSVSHGSVFFPRGNAEENQARKRCFGCTAAPVFPPRTFYPALTVSQLWVFPRF